MRTLPVSLQYGIKCDFPSLWLPPHNRSISGEMSYLLPSDEETLSGACAFKDSICAWVGRRAYRWDQGQGWTAFSEAPAEIESGFELQSGVLAGTDSHVGFLPADGSDWAGWADLSTFSDAHPMFGDLLLCTDRSSDSYILFDISASGLDQISGFDSEELAQPLAGWSSPTNPERLLLLGDDGLWALDPPYLEESLQHLVSFDGVELPALSDIPGPFQPGSATVVIPRRVHTALRLDLSSGTGKATGLKHVAGGAALWNAYLHDDRAVAAQLLATLGRLPAPSQGPGADLYDVLVDNGDVGTAATSAGLWMPDDSNPEAARTADNLPDAALDGPALTTWALWLGWDGAMEAACRELCNSAAPDYGLAESLWTFAGNEACRTLFDLLQSESPPPGPGGEYEYPLPAIRALVAPMGSEAAPFVSSALSTASVPARVAACAASGTTEADLPSARSDRRSSAPSGESVPLLWNDDHPVPKASLRANVTHDHPAVRAAAHDACMRLQIEDTPSPQRT